MLLDVHLPDTNGLEVLRRMRAAGHTTDVIMVTQARDLAVVRAAIAFGATQYLVKPFTSGAVRAKLEGYLAYRDRLAAGRPIAQDDVDGLFDALRAPVGADALPKTVSRETLDAVVGALRPGHRDDGAGGRVGAGHVPGDRAPVPGAPGRRGPGRARAPLRRHRVARSWSTGVPGTTP